MPIYEWICESCSIYWDRECSIGKAPKRTKCPKCKTLCEKYIGNQNVGVSFNDDGAGNKNNPGANDFHTVKSRYKKFAQEGYDQQSGDRFLRRHIEKTKNAMDDESFRYMPANIKWDKLAEDRGIKKVSEDVAKKKLESARKLTAEAYDRANKMGYKDIGKTELDITKPTKQS